MPVSVIILTFNSAAAIEDTLASVTDLSDDVHVVDSGSTDNTVQIARRAGARVVQHRFENYGAQRNWAIDHLPLRYDWELHLDADERLSPELREAIRSLAEGGFPPPVMGYFIPRLVYFMGLPIRHGGMYPIWHMRLFKHGAGRCETRRYDQHFVVNGPTARLNHPMIDDIRMPLDEWILRHNRWATAEVEEMMFGRNGGGIKHKFNGDPVQRQRALRQLYCKFPPLIRPFLLFIYRYILRLGFLDGRPGLIFFALQTLWFRFLIDAKLFEQQLKIERLEPADDSLQSASASAESSSKR
jgi:glycosyltransferase involved in cell wall biosynthesis